jgi:hypothetical protein
VLAVIVVPVVVTGLSLLILRGIVHSPLLVIVVISPLIFVVVLFGLSILPPLTLADGTHY